MVNGFVVATDVEQPFLIEDNGTIHHNPEYDPNGGKKIEPKIQKARFMSPPEPKEEKQSIFATLRAAVLGSIENPPVIKVTGLEDFPQINGQVYVRVMPFDDKAKVDACLHANDWNYANPKVTATIVRYTACGLKDSGNELIFTDTDLPALESTYDGRFIEAVSAQACRLNGYWQTAKKDLVGN